jgi:hypothetical protein
MSPHPTPPPPAPLPPPTKHQLALMIWLAVFPTLTLLNLALGNWLTTLAPVLRTLVLATVAVPIVIYGLMPHLHRLRAPVDAIRPRVRPPGRPRDGSAGRLTPGVSTAPRNRRPYGAPRRSRFGCDGALLEPDDVGDAHPVKGAAPRAAVGHPRPEALGPGALPGRPRFGVVISMSTSGALDTIWQ